MTEGKPRLAVLHSGLGLVERGIERVLLSLYPHLAEDFDVTVFGSGPTGAMPVVPIASITRLNDGYQALFTRPSVLPRVLTRLHLSPTELEKLTFTVGALPHLLETQYDAVLLSTGYWGCRLSRLPRFVKGSRIVCRSGGWMMSSFESAQFHPDLHITDNPEVATALQEKYPNDRITHIPNGVDLSTFSPGESPLTFELERPIFLCAGAFEPTKRAHLAIEAVAELGAGSLILLGQGEKEKELRALGDRLLGSRRFRICQAAFSEMRDYYNACDVFTLPSERESFGLVCLEAMACGKVVVSQDDLVRRTILGEAGIVCDCADVTAYSDALRKACDTVLSMAPRTQAGRYDWPSVARRYTDEINHTLGIDRSAS